MSGETCSVCNWTNTECLNLGDVGKPKWMCHGCIKRAVDSLQSHNENHYQEACKLRERLTAYEKQWTDMDYTIGHLRQDNERLRGEVESLNKDLKREVDDHDKAETDLQSHKAALDKAAVALDKCDCFCGVSESDGDRKLCDRCQGLATINELLQKGSK